MKFFRLFLKQFSGRLRVHAVFCIYSLVIFCEILSCMSIRVEKSELAYKWNRHSFIMRNKSMWQKCISCLFCMINFPFTFTPERVHYLSITNCSTWERWEKNGIRESGLDCVCRPNIIGMDEWLCYWYYYLNWNKKLTFFN